MKVVDSLICTPPTGGKLSKVSVWDLLFFLVLVCVFIVWNMKADLKESLY